MKHKKGFFIFIILLILINSAILLLLKYGNLNEKVKIKISDTLSKTLKAKVSIGNLSLNDKQLNISKFKITANDGSFSVCSKQIYVEFNLISLLKERFKNLKGISLIKIYDPKINVSIKKSKKKKNDKPFKIPVLRNYFKRLEIVNGLFSVQYKNKNIYFKQTLKNIDLKIKNKRKTGDILLTANGINQDSLYAKIKLKKSELKNINIELTNFFPDSLYIKNFPDLTARLNLKIKKDKNNDIISGTLADNNITYDKWNLKAKKLNIRGNSKSVVILFEDNSFIDGYPVSGRLGIDNFLTSPQFNSQLSVQNVDVEKYARYVFGKADAKVVLKGKISSPQVYITGKSKKLKIASETLYNSDVSAKYKSGKFSFAVHKTVWENNFLSASGYITSKNGVVVSLKKNNLHLKRYGFDISGNLSASFNYKKRSVLNVRLLNMSLKNKSINLNNLEAEAKLLNSKWSFDLNAKENILLKAKGNFKDKNLSANLKLKHLKLSKIFNNIVFPITSGTIEVKKTKNKLTSNADIIFYDQNFGKFDGEIRYDFLIDYLRNVSSLNMNTLRARYNFEPFYITMLGKGSADSLNIYDLKINDKVTMKGFVKWKPKFDVGFRMIGNNLYPSDILRYLTDYETTKKYNGKFNFALNYSGLTNKNIEGVIDVKSFGINNLNNLDAYITFFGNKSFFTLDKMFLYQNSKKIFAAQGNMIFKPYIRAKITGKLKNLDLEQLTDDKSLKGKLNGYFAYFIKRNKKTLDLELFSSKAKLLGINTDSLYVAISQNNKILNVINCFVKRKNKFNLTARGKIGYNIFNRNFYNTKDTLLINFKGDLLENLKKRIKALEQGSSKTNLSLKLSTNENGLKIISGNLLIKNGMLKIKNQPAPVEKINVQMYIKDNKLEIKKFKLKVGSGYLNIKNVITNKDEDFRFANLNLGKLLVKTSSSGILLFIPGYVPEGSFLNVKIAGRYSDYLSVNGPFDDIKIVGDIEVSNGSLVYPPHTENLLKIIKTPINTKKKESEVIYPFSLDLTLKIGDNLHYTTYPINLLMKKGSYLNLIYKDGAFSIPDAFFVSEKGDIDIFGTDMKADYVSVKINKFINGFKLNAEFYKDIPDGTRVTMVVYTKTEKGKNKIQFRFTSDRAGDSTMDIISMLRYGKRIEDISGSQRNTLLQDELVQIAGLSIENAFITPLFYPFENFVKHLFKLDYFNIKTGIIQNVFNTYYNKNDDSQDFANDENKITKFGMDMFLNNLTLQFTKHLYKKTFLDYQVSFQKSANLAIQSKLGIYQELSLKIEIPYKFRLSLNYNIRPFYEKNSFQIGIEKSIKFY